MTWIAALPMYNVTPALATVWREWLDDVLRMVSPACRIIEPDEELHGFWRRPNVLLSQTCGYPLMHGLNEQVQVIATPRFDAPGCIGTDYSSVLVTRAEAQFDSLAACRGARAAYNQDDSNSGMNVFRHAVAPLARDGAFFSAVLRTGSHLGSLRAVVDNRADVAAIDCVTFARSQRTVQWLPKNGTLLDLAEACGIAAPSSCRSGMCGTCSTRVLNGRVAYEDPTDAPIDAGHALICMGRPVADDVAAKDGLSLEL